MEDGKWKLRIYDLAKKMINLYGYDVIDGNSSKDGIEIIFTGLRSGEKTYEELLVTGNEKSTQNNLIFRDNCSSEFSKQEFEFIKNELDEIINTIDIDRFKKISKEFASYGKAQTG